jgi:FlaA1/EpsC-like NDP-sugar epimerase
MKRVRRFLMSRRSALIFVLLAASVSAALAGAFLLRFDFHIPEEELARLEFAILLALPLKIAVYYFTLLDRGWWSNASFEDAKRILCATIAASVLASGAIAYSSDPGFPRSIYLLDLLLSFLFIAAGRFLSRLVHETKRLRQTKGTPQRKILVYGAGSAGLALLRELRDNPDLGYSAVGLIDDDRFKRDELAGGVRVYGSGIELPAIVQRFRKRGIKIEEVIIAIPAATGRQMREVLAHCRAAGLVCKTLPGVADLLTSKFLSAQIRSIAIEDLLGREPVALDHSEIRRMLTGTRVLVTGAGGSIGSELCRQVAAFDPAAIVLMDNAESAVFAIDLELRRKFPNLSLFPAIGDIRDRERVDQIMAGHSVEVVFHAAAYKHVPLMEAHVVQAVQNNVIGTWNVVNSAEAHKVKSFVMISSDKAVNPTNVMGATKRVTELILSTFPRKSSTRFVAVRFGNVLGSNGSVLPLFQAQIAAGRPVTVTHPEIRRYFMTIREAVELVLQASTMGRRSDIFVLDMGQPVRIADLAVNLIRLAGLVPGRDIQIEYTGLRPGEKLFEELITEGENVQPTYHPKIKIFRGSPAAVGAVERWIKDTYAAVERRDEEGLVTLLTELVPEYVPAPQWVDRLRPKIVQMSAGISQKKVSV